MLHQYYCLNMSIFLSIYLDNQRHVVVNQMHHHFYPLTPYQVSQYLFLHFEPDVTSICGSVLSSSYIGTCKLNPLFVLSGVRSIVLPTPVFIQRSQFFLDSSTMSTSSSTSTIQYSSAANSASSTVITSASELKATFSATAHIINFIQPYRSSILRC